MHYPGFHPQLIAMKKVLELDCGGVWKQCKGYTATFIVCVLENKLSVLIPMFSVLVG